jgi:heme/copper-type cytochrome/quinol oxidase subunit 3
LIVTVAALRLRITRSKRNAVDVTVLYWHFMDGLWIYLFVLLFFFRQ